MPCCTPAAEPAFSCSLAGLQNECILSFTTSFKSDNIFGEQNRGSRGKGGDRLCFLQGRTHKIGLVFCKCCQPGEARDSGGEPSRSHFSAPPSPTPGLATHCCLGFGIRVARAGSLKNLELVLPGESPFPRADQRGSHTAVFTPRLCQSAALSENKPRCARQ